MALRHPRPVVDTGAAQGVDAEADLRAANDVQVDHVAEVVDVGVEDSRSDASWSNAVPARAEFVLPL